MSFIIWQQPDRSAGLKVDANERKVELSLSCVFGTKVPGNALLKGKSHMISLTDRLRPNQR